MDDNFQFLPFHLTFLPDFIKKKAEEELFETRDQKEKCLKILKLLLKDESELIANTNDDFLIRFLRTKKYNCQKSFSLIKRYYNHRRKYPSIYKDFMPSSLLHVQNLNIVGFLPYRTSDGCAIWVSRFGDWDSNLCTFDELLKFGLMSLEMSSKYECTQISGVVNVIDLKNFSYKQLFHLTPSKLHCFVSSIQDCFPLRQKDTHILFEPKLFSFLFTVLRPMLSEKMKRRIYLHGYDMESLHQYIPPEILPEEFGGHLGPFQCDDFYKNLLNFEPKLLESQHYGYIST